MRPLVLASTLTATYPQFIARDSLLQNNWTRRIPGTLKTKQKCLLPVFCIYTCLWTIIVSQKMQCNYKLLCIGFIFLHIGNNKNKALKKFLKNWKVEYYITNPRTEPDQKLFLHCTVVKQRNYVILPFLHGKYWFLVSFLLAKCQQSHTFWIRIWNAFCVEILTLPDLLKMSIMSIGHKSIS